MRLGRRGGYAGLPGRSGLSVGAALALALLALACSNAEPELDAEVDAEIEVAGPVADWPAYGGDIGGARYSSLTQINRRNVEQLEIAWTYHTGDVDFGTQTLIGTAFQNTPIVVGDTLYLCSPRNKAIALDAASGRERWVYDAQVDTSGMYIVQPPPTMTI